MDVYVAKHFSDTVLSKTSLDLVVKYMQTDDELRVGVEEIRDLRFQYMEAIKNKEDKAIIDDWKSKVDSAKKLHLGYLTFSQFTDNKRNNKNYESATVQMFDVDKIPMSKREKVFNKITEADGVLLAFRSPSGDGVKFAVEYDAEIPKDDFVAVYRQTLKYFQTLIEHDIDQSTSDPARFCFYSYDPELYYNPNNEPRNLEYILGMIRSNQSVLGHRSLAIVEYNTSTQGFDDLYDYMTKEKGYSRIDGQSNTEMIALSRPGVTHRSATLFTGQGTERDGYIGLYLFTDNDESLQSSPEKFGETGFSGYRPFDILVNERYKGNFEEAEKHIYELGFRGSLIEDHNDMAVIWSALASIYQFRYDVRKRRLWFNKNNTGWEYMTDRELAKMLFFLNGKFTKKISKDYLKDTIDAKTAEIDPLMDWVRDLRAIKLQDKYDYIRNHFIKSWGKEIGADRFNLTMLKKWMVGAIASVIRPEVTNELCMVFKGGQGIGKSKFLRSLCPDSISDFYYEGHIDESKDSKFRAATNMIVNLDELEGTFGKAKTATLKSLMTINEIQERLNYDRYSQDYVRFSSFCGSVNQDEFLNDPTGARRFPVIDVENTSCNFDYVMNIGDGVNVVWAYALKLFEDGYNYWLNEDDIKKVNLRAKAYSYKGAYEEEIRDNYVICDDDFYNRFIFKENKNPKVVVCINRAGDYKFIHKKDFKKIKKWDMFKKIDVSYMSTSQIVRAIRGNDHFDDGVLKKVGRTLKNMGSVTKSAKEYDENGNFKKNLGRVHLMVRTRYIYDAIEHNEGSIVAVTPSGELVTKESLEN